MFESTPWLWAYWPVRKVAREGQQSANDAKLLSKDVPWAMSSRLTFFMTRIDSTVWSSVMITTMFGRCGGRECAAGAPTAPEETAATQSSTPAIESGVLRIVRIIRRDVRLCLPQRPREKYSRLGTQPRPLASLFVKLNIAATSAMSRMSSSLQPASRSSSTSSSVHEDESAVSLRA